MIPNVVQDRLRQRYASFEHHVCPEAPHRAAHVCGHPVARPVLVRIGADLVVAVVPADARLNLHPLEEATGQRATVVPGEEAAERFRPCEPGAEAPLAIFGVPIYVDDDLARERTLLLPAGTHADAVVVETSEWIWSERVRPIAHLGLRARWSAPWP